MKLTPEERMDLISNLIEEEKQMKPVINTAVNPTADQLTKLAIMVNGYGGTVEMESAPGVWIVIHNPLFMEGKNFRPKNEGGFRG